MTLTLKSATPLVTTLALLTLPLPALAQNVITQSTTIRDQLCVGPACLNTETYDSFSATLRLRSFANRIDFIDTDNGLPDTDWQLKANDDNGPLERFMLRDLTAGTTPVSILGTAPDNSLYVAANGDVGLGTSIPQIPLHVTSQSSAGIGIERTNAQGGPQLWEIATFFNGDFVLFDRTNGTGPFAARAGAPNNGIFLDSDTAKINGGSRDYNFLVRWDSGSSLWADGGTGDIGMGTNAPTAPLHVLRNDGTAQLLIEDTGTNNGNLSMVQLTNRSGRARMQFTSVGNPNQTGDWSISSGLTFVLQERLTGQNVFIMDNQGNLNITGELTTAGSCAAGCDRVFDADYDLPSIAEHQSAMWTNGYLPNVGPTPEDGPFNVSDKMGRMLNELEHAHIFIGQQERRIAALEAELEAKDAVLAARLGRIEAALAVQ